MLCPCHSGETYENCCGPYHQGKTPPHALALMRSRYSAYALKNIDYIIATTHPDHPDSKQPEATRRAQIVSFAQNTQFQGLEILEFTDKQPYSTVTFRVHLVQQGKPLSYTEQSEFGQVHGKWMYRRAISFIS